MKENKDGQMNIGVLLFGTGHHQAAWMMADSDIEEIDQIHYYQSLGRLAEKGLLDAVFFADNQSFRSDKDSDMPSFWYDPLINLTAISQVTSHIGLVSTLSSTFSQPYAAARQILSLDHATNGRVGWNLVTSMTDAEAQNYGMNKLPDRDVRYERADEFATVMNKLFHSWDEKDFIHERETNQLIDATNIKPFDHKGKYFQIKGPLSTPKSPQGSPVSMQAGASTQGIALAAKYADAVYAVCWNIRQARRYRKRLNEQISKMDQGFRSIKVFPGLVTYVGKTREEALAKKKALDVQLPVEIALKQLSFFVQEDCSSWELDKVVPELAPVSEFTGPIGRYETILEIIHDYNPTVRELLGFLNAGGGHLTLIGTAKEIVDEMEIWFQEGVADGFNLMPPTLPGSLEDFVEYIVPELQRRGLYRLAYEGRTLREHFQL